LLHELAINDDAMDEIINDICTALLAAGPHALREAKSLIATVANKSIGEALVAETAQRIARVRASEEGREGLAAFLEKRKAAWIKAPLP
jgi:methylglutaconyl-CoA hydratase